MRWVRGVAWSADRKASRSAKPAFPGRRSWQGWLCLGDDDNADDQALVGMGLARARLVPASPIAGRSYTVAGVSCD